MEPMLIDCHIQIDNIASFEWPAVGDAVADYFINRCAQGFRELVVIVWGRICFVFYDEVMHFGVDLVGCDASLNQRVP